MTAPQAPYNPPAPLIEREPVALGFGSIGALASALIAAATAFDWVSLTNDQAAAIVGVIVAGSALGAGVIRSAVYSPATHARELAAAKNP